MFCFKHVVAILFLVLCLIADCRASSPAKNLIIKSMPDVTVVFVNPASMPKVEGSEAKKDMSYDLTLDSRSDSVSFTASVLTASPTVIDMVQITYGDSCVSLPVEKIFIEPEGSAWQSRLRVYIPKDLFNNLLYCEYSPTFTWGTDASAPMFRHKTDKWLSVRQTFRLADEVIGRNRVYERPSKNILNDIENDIEQGMEEFLGL